MPLSLLPFKVFGMEMNVYVTRASLVTAASFSIAQEAFLVPGELQFMTNTTNVPIMACVIIPRPSVSALQDGPGYHANRINARQPTDLPVTAKVRAILQLVRTLSAHALALSHTSGMLVNSSTAHSRNRVPMEKNSTESTPNALNTEVVI